MKKYFNITIYILFFFLLFSVFYNPEACMAKEFDASLNVMSYDRNVTIKINDIPINRITGGQSQSVRLFLANDPMINQVPAARQKTMKELFCLKQGQNTIEIIFNQKGRPKSPSLMTVSIDSENYKVPVFQYIKKADVKEGKVKGTFEIFIDEPAGFKTVILQ